MSSCGPTPGFFLSCWNFLLLQGRGCALAWVAAAAKWGSVFLSAWRRLGTKISGLISSVK